MERKDIKDFLSYLPLIAVKNVRAENKWKYGRDYKRYVGYLFEREGFSVIYNGATKGSSDGGYGRIS